MTGRFSMIALACGLALAACGGDTRELDAVTSSAGAQDAVTVEAAGTFDAHEADSARTDGLGPDVCVPQCGEGGTESECGPDGCGGSCGGCEAGAVCGEADYAPVRVCFNPAEECPDICAGENAECGTVWTGLAEPEDCSCGECPPEKPVCTESRMCATGPVAEGELGWPCESNEDCISGYCLPAANGHVCSMECLEDCPAGYACGAADPMWGVVMGTICYPEFLELCRPCMADEDCYYPVMAGRCTFQGDQGSFCSSECESGAECPEGYVCQPGLDLAGDQFSGCMPDGTTCACSQHFTEENASTACVVDNLFGKCSGERHCTPDGFTVCSASTPENEACDGPDNDCDGETDEAWPDSDGDGLADCCCDESDNDGVPDWEDNCPQDDNADQADFDQDLVGDVCDPDDDNDLVADEEDCAPFDSDVYPGAVESCDGKDNDCDGEVDEGCECVPHCAGKECGSDGCGGECPDLCNHECPGPQVCTAEGFCESACVPNCEGKQCGDDGCGCPCGECPAGGWCTGNGLCMTDPACSATIRPAR